MADNAKGSQETVKTLDEQINEVLATADDKGQLTFSDEVDPLFKKLVLTEKKARGHQAKAIKSIQEVTTLKATNQVLSDTINSSIQLSAEQTAELDELKHLDPDEWFVKKLQFETENKNSTEGKLLELANEASTKALKELTLGDRQTALDEFQKRTGVILTDDVMENDIPPRLQKKIEELPFTDYLNEVAKYLGKDKVVKNTDSSLDTVNIGNFAGSEETKKAKKAKYQIL